MNRSRGFTLLELLIGMALLGLILMLLYGGFHLAAQIWDGVEVKAEQSSDEQAGRSLIRRVVGQAQPIHWKVQNEQPLAFSAERETLRMIAPLGQIGLRVVELSVEPDERPGDQRTMRVVLRHGPLIYTAEHFTEGLADQEIKPLLGGLTAAEFNYFGAETPTTEPQWLDHWSRTDQFPTMVRLRITSKGAEPLDLDVALMVNGNRNATVRLTAGPV